MFYQNKEISLDSIREESFGSGLSIQIRYNSVASRSVCASGLIFCYVFEFQVPIRS